jgi:hypothetical protein
VHVTGSLSTKNRPNPKIVLIGHPDFAAEGAIRANTGNGSLKLHVFEPSFWATLLGVFKTYRWTHVIMCLCSRILLHDAE